MHALNIDDDTNPLNLANINRNYHDVHDILSDNFRNINFHCRVLHLNIQGLAAKFDNLKNLLSHLSEAHVDIDYILLCETFLNDNNAYLYKLPNYNMIYKNKKAKSKSDVAIYVREDIQYNIRDDLGIFVEGEFESIFIQSNDKGSASIVGEIYCLRNTEVSSSLKYYESVLNKIRN